jgi:hypothetical protein
VAKILICGDSFSCSDDRSWADMLAQTHEVTNVSSRGASEYRIWLQYQNNLDRQWDRVIVCHTSANRVYCEKNFFHDPQGPYGSCDLIYQDILEKRTLPATHVKWWFENVFDVDQAKLYHRLLIEHWTAIAPSNQILHITFFDYGMDNVHQFRDIWSAYPGTINHLTYQGNALVLERILQLLNMGARSPHGRFKS